MANIFQNLKINKQICEYIESTKFMSHKPIKSKIKEVS